MKNAPTLYLHPAVVEWSTLESVTSHLLLFAPAVFLNCRALPADAELGRRLIEMTEAGFIRPWAYPGDIDTSLAEWTSRADIREISTETYREISLVAKETVRVARKAIESESHARPVELVQTSWAVWGCCLAENLATEQILADYSRVGGLARVVQQVAFKQRVADEFLKLMIEPQASLSALTIEDLIALRRKHAATISTWLDKKIHGWPAEFSADASVERSLKKLVKEYQADINELIRKHPSTATRAGTLAIDILAVVLWPFGFLSVARDLADLRRQDSELRVQWFLSDLKRRIERTREPRPWLFRK